MVGVEPIETGDVEQDFIFAYRGEVCGVSRMTQAFQGCRSLSKIV